LEKVDTNTRKSTSQPDESAAADDKMANIHRRDESSGAEKKIPRGGPAWRPIEDLTWETGPAVAETPSGSESGRRRQVDRLCPVATKIESEK
jgi:hypothetical protein